MASLLYKPPYYHSTAPQFTNRWGWSVVAWWVQDDRQKLRPIKNSFQQVELISSYSGSDARQPSA
jgi:hypothetical protein